MKTLKQTLEQHNVCDRVQPCHAEEFQTRTDNAIKGLILDVTEHIAQLLDHHDSPFQVLRHDAKHDHIKNANPGASNKTNHHSETGPGR